MNPVQNEKKLILNSDERLKKAKNQSITRKKRGSKKLSAHRSSSKANVQQGIKKSISNENQDRTLKKQKSLRVPKNKKTKNDPDELTKKRSKNTKRSHTKSISKENLVVKKKQGSVVEDKMPEALKIVKLDVEERTCARTKKKKNEVVIRYMEESTQKAESDDDFINNENNGKLFDKHNNPFWTLVLFDAEEAEKEGIEVEGRITAEHVLKFLEGTLAPVPPADIKYTFDCTKDVEEMREVDDAFFSEDAVMYHTLRNIMSSERAMKRCTLNDEASRHQKKIPVVQTKGFAQIENLHKTIRFIKPDVERFTYSRDKPIESIRKCRENLKKWDAI